MHEGTEKEEADDVEEEAEDVKLPTNKEILEALQVLRIAVQQGSSNFEKHYDYEKFISEIIDNNKKQKK